jgi:hypothetical protein
MPFGDKYRGRVGAYLLLCGTVGYYPYVELVLNILKRLPNGVRMVILRMLASQFIYHARNLPVVGFAVKALTPGVSNHPSKGYRLINLYDAFSPSFSEASDEADAIGWAKKFGFGIVTFVRWRLGFVGEKP